jgi:hypothetical protein
MFTPDDALFLLAFSSCLLAMSALPYIFWRTPGNRFALVVSLLLVYAVYWLPWYGGNPGGRTEWSETEVPFLILRSVALHGHPTLL